MGVRTSARPDRSFIPALVTGLAIAFLLLPLVVVVLFSLQSSASLAFPFDGPSLRWYRVVLDDPTFQQALLHSLVVASCVAIATFVLGTLAAYATTRSVSRWGAPITVLLLLPIALPGLVVGISLLTYFRRLHVTLSLVTVALAHTVYVLPYFYLLARAALDRLDRRLEDAAADLGASPSLTFRRVVLPQIWPLLLSATLLSFLLSFDEFVITNFVLTGAQTLPTFIFSRLRTTVDPTINVVSTFLMVGSVMVWAFGFAVAVRTMRSRSRVVLDPTRGV